MIVQPSNQAGEILIDCLDCGKLYPVADFRTGEFADVLRQSFERSRRCPECANRRRQDREQREREIERQVRQTRLPEILAASGVDYLYCHDRATGKLFSSPPVRFVAEWIWTHRRENLLLSGPTGTGKSTSAGFVATRLIADGRKVRYTNLRRLLSSWRQAKTGDDTFAVEKLLCRIFSQEVFILDEVIGKAKVSESGQELLFEILESVNSGACRAKLWLLGNFYSGSIEDLFADPEPVRRRLQENFTCAVIDRQLRSVRPIPVWEERP